MVGFLEKLFRSGKQQTDKPIEQFARKAPLTFRDLLEECFIYNEEGYELSKEVKTSVTNPITYRYHFLFEKDPERLWEGLDEIELEQVFLLCFISRKLLCDEIKSLFPVWIRAYKKYLKLRPEIRCPKLSPENGLFLFGFNKKYRLENAVSFDDYRQYYSFFAKNNTWDFRQTGDSGFLFYFDRLQINEKSLKRMSEMLLLTMGKDRIYEDRFVWPAYFILLLNPSDTSEVIKDRIDTLKIKSRKFLLKKERLEQLAEQYRSMAEPKNYYYWYGLDRKLYHKQIEAELRKMDLPGLMKQLDLTPTSLFGRFSVVFSTADFSDCNKEGVSPALTEKDALLGFHLYTRGHWVVDLQWYLPSEKDHHIRRPGHDRPRVVWRNNADRVIGYNPVLKKKAPDFHDPLSFPRFVKQIEEAFELSFNRPPEISVQGIKIRDEEVIWEWLFSQGDHTFE